MADKQFLTPAEIAESLVEGAQVKASSGTAKLLALGVIAGIFIAFGAHGSTMAAHNLLLRPELQGLGRMVAGLIFGTGLILVTVAGGELFTGNNLMIVSLLERRISGLSMFRNWLLVYLGNFAGAMAVAALVVFSGIFNTSAGNLGAMAVRIAVTKINLGFWQAFTLGILCNFLVCGAVWMACGARDIAGKVLVCLFPICLFVTSGFEHSIANMFYIPAGIWASSNNLWLEAAKISQEALAGLTWANFLTRNLLPVTLGNTLAGCLLGSVYWFSFLRSR